MELFFEILLGALLSNFSAETYVTEDGSLTFQISIDIKETAKDVEEVMSAHLFSGKEKAA